MNHTRFRKVDHLPDWARRDNKVTKGDSVECRIRVGSFSPRNFLCGDSFICRLIINNFTSRVRVHNSIKYSSALVRDTAILLSASIHSSTSTLHHILGSRGPVFQTWHQFMNCVFIANIKSRDVFFAQAPPAVITAGHNFLQAWRTVFAFTELHAHAKLKTAFLIVLAC